MFNSNCLIKIPQALLYASGNIAQALFITIQRRLIARFYG